MKNYEDEIVSCEEVDGICRYFNFRGDLLFTLKKEFVDGLVQYHTGTSKHYVIAAMEDLHLALGRLECAKRIFADD